MSEQEGIYPTATKEFGERQKALAPRTAEASRVFSKRIRRRGRLRENQAANRCSGRARNSMSILHLRAYKVGLAKRSNSEEIMEAIWVAAEMRGGGEPMPFDTRA